MAVFDVIFQSLFAYRPIVFEQGEFRFDPSAGSYFAAALGVVVAAAAVFTYRHVGGRGRPRDRAVLLSLRAVALALVLACLFRPILVVKAAVPQQNVVGVLLDDSRSMEVADWNGQPRGAFVRDQFGSPDSPVIRALSERFLVRTFRFSSTAARTSGKDDLTFAGGQTRLGAALNAARHELAGLPLSGLVLVTDGADTSEDEDALADALLGLKAEKLPVITVGVGQKALSRDVQLDRISTPRSVLVGTSLLIDVIITQTGYAGDTVTLDVEDEGRIVGSQQVRLPADGAPATVRVRAMASEPGPRVFRFRVQPQRGELITQNNVRDVTIDVRDTLQKILYFEGEPRFEMKFINRAVADDKNLQVVSLQRTADNKYLRLKVDDADELVGGFPKTREELFSYRGLILGSIEAGAFTGDQLRMIADFVDRRGGGLLMIGGGRSFGEGGYAGTPVADVLPVHIERPTGATGLARLKVEPTRAGTAHAVTQIEATESASIDRWKQLPQVTSVNALATLKPGAAVLLNGLDERARMQIVLASQRYGRGKTLVFTPQDSWIWQMHATIPLEDQTHEHFWRQLMRWLVDGVPETVEVRAPDRVDPGEEMTLEATVVDRSFLELNDARVVASVRTPGGDVVEVPLRWTGEHAGQYRGVFTADRPGSYQVEVAAERAGTALGTGIAHLRAAPGDAEYFDATMHEPVLRRIAEETTGRFYSAGEVAGLAEDVKYVGRGVTTVEERELWHMPVVFIALLGIVCAEWAYRRTAGLA